MMQPQGAPVLRCCCIIVLAAARACAFRGNLHIHAHHQPQHAQHGDLDAITEEPVYALFDFTAAQDIGTPQTAVGHQALSSFWQPHLQRAARAELALSVHSAAKRAEREHRAAWHQRKGHERKQRSAQNPVVISGSPLFWGDIYGSTKDLGPEQCEVPCRWAVGEADMQADMLLGMAMYSAAEIQSLQRQRPEQTVALFSMEPIWGLTASAMDPHLKHWDVMATVSAHSDAPIGYADSLREFLEGDAQAAFEAEHPLPEEWLRGPKGVLATFISTGCGKDPDEDWGSEYSARVRLIRDLAAAGIPMDHFGGCKFGQSEAATAKLPSAQVPGSTYGDRQGQRRKVQIMRAYRFALGAENTVAADYITEKFWQLFGSRRLPVYLGAPNAGTYAPPHSFVNVLEHTPEQLARLLRLLDSDQEAYDAYFDWQKGGRDGELTSHFGRALSEHVLFGERKDGMGWVCRLCVTQHKYFDFQSSNSTH